MKESNLRFSAFCFFFKLDGRTEGGVDSREKLLEFCFDYCYWSVDPADPHYASQEEVKFNFLLHGFFFKGFSNFTNDTDGAQDRKRLKG